MFEIGSSLREARIRRRLDHARIEAGTKIRTRYLTALEEEQFELLPGEAYAKAFLRTYAEYLGLDGQLYVEYSSRFGNREEPVVTSPRPRVLTPGFKALVIGLIGFAAVMLLVVAWKVG